MGEGRTVYNLRAKWRPSPISLYREGKYGQVATLTVKKTTKDANGTSTSTTTQEFKLSGNDCLVSR